MLLFDLDGTLVDSSFIWDQIDIDFTRRHNLPLTAEYKDFVAHASAPAAAVFTKDYYHLDLSTDEIIQEWNDQALEAYSGTIDLKAGVSDYLEQCRRQGHRMAVVTSSPANLCRMVLEKHRLLPYFEELFFAEQLGVEKKDPKLYQLVAHKLGVDVSSCHVFDDSPLACRSARTAGAFVTGMHDALFADAEREMRSFCNEYVYSFSDLLEAES